jgi:hypothetical protein
MTRVLSHRIFTGLPLDRPSYPAFDIYPAVTDVDSIYSNLPEADSVNVHLPEVYPRITPCQSYNQILYGQADSDFMTDPTVYPEFDLYPPVIVGTDDVPKTALTYHYPCIKTCASTKASRLLR